MVRLIFGKKKRSYYVETEENEEGVCVGSKIFLVEKTEGWGTSPSNFP